MKPSMCVSFLSLIKAKSFAANQVRLPQADKGNEIYETRLPLRDADAGADGRSASASSVAGDNAVPGYR